MRRCKNCLMAETKPGVRLDAEELCQACVHHDMRSQVDYDARFEKLRELADQYRRDDGGYECIVPVSGGKSSYYQTHIATEVLDLNPLLVRVSNSLTNTEAGNHNLRNLREAFAVDVFTIELDPTMEREMVKIGFEEMGYPLWPHERAIQATPVRLAVNMNIPFIIYGENANWEYGGDAYDHRDEEPDNAKSQVYNNIVPNLDDDFWIEKGFSRADLNMFQYPSSDEIDEGNVMPIWLSYYLPWDVHKSYQVAKKYGFRDLTHEWDREGFIDDFDAIDSFGYLISNRLKYPKYGFARVTDMVGYKRRSDLTDLSLREGKRLIEEHDHKFDREAVDDFLDYTGYSYTEFWEIVERFRNEDLFETRFDGFEPTEKDGLPAVENDFENIDLD